MATKKMAMGGMGGKMAGVTKAIAGKAAEAGKARQAQAAQAQKSATADKMKAAAKDFMAKRAAEPARPTTERIPRPAGTVSPNAARMVGKPLGGATTMGSRAGVTMTPQIKQGLQNMSDKLRGMPMKKGGKAKGKK